MGQTLSPRRRTRRTRGPSRSSSWRCIVRCHRRFSGRGVADGHCSGRRTGSTRACRIRILETDSETVATIKELLDTRVRPAIKKGRRGYRAFRVHRRGDRATQAELLKGSCRGCDSSTVMLKTGIGRMSSDQADSHTRAVLPLTLKSKAATSQPANANANAARPPRSQHCCHLSTSPPLDVLLAPTRLLMSRLQSQSCPRPPPSCP
jgi:Fe-S cluster biogenesis protein NfuA